jgi:hypothetical protein
MTPVPEPIERGEYPTAALMAGYRPAWGHPNKQVVFEIACPPGAMHRGQLAFSRWAAMALPETVEAAHAASMVRVQDGFYDYAPAPGQQAGMEWHVNFADPHLFVAYASSLFAQDEMQVAEHPALGALRETLIAHGLRAVTIEKCEPTPVLVMGVERRCRIATDPDATEGRASGLYGNAFASADADAVRRATTPIDPPTTTNLVAMAAPRGGPGPYRAGEIEGALTTAFTGFRAATLESRRELGPGTPVAVHTGFWGCGAFGGNRVLMALLQVVAARLAKLDLLVFHVGGRGGRAPLEEALRRVDGDLPIGEVGSVRDALHRIEAMRFEWGVGDGN